MLVAGKSEKTVYWVYVKTGPSTGFRVSFDISLRTLLHGKLELAPRLLVDLGKPLKGRKGMGNQPENGTGQTAGCGSEESPDLEHRAPLEVREHQHGAFF